MTRLDFFLFFFFLILFAPFFFPVLTHTQGSGQLGFHSLFTVWAWTGSWVLYNLHTHTHTYNIWHLHGVETHTHTTVGACQYISPLVNIYNLLAAGATYQQRRRLQFNYDNRRPDKTFVWTVHVCFSRQPRKCEQFQLDGISNQRL